MPDAELTQRRLELDRRDAHGRRRRPLPARLLAVACPRQHPISLGLHQNTLIAVNGAEDPAQASGDPSRRLTVFDLLPGGFPLCAFAAAVENGTRALPPGPWSDPHAPWLHDGFADNEQPGTRRCDPTGGSSLTNVAKNSGQAPCWIRATGDGRCLHTADTADVSNAAGAIASPPDRPAGR